MKRNSNPQRSTLGGHFAGTGIAGPTSKEFDDHMVERGVKLPKHGMLPTDKLKDKKDFDAYVKSMSGEVKKYNLKDETPKD